VALLAEKWNDDELTVKLRLRTSAGDRRSATSLTMSTGRDPTASAAGDDP